jgi:hypothetical protein
MLMLDRKHEYDKLGQQERRVQICGRFVADTLQLLQDDNLWQAKGMVDHIRERTWVALVYMEHGSAQAVDAANRIITTSAFHFCHFTPMISLQMLTRYGHLLTEEAVNVLDSYVKGVIEHFTGCDMDYIGVNDNFPSMAAYSCLIAGKRYGDRALYQVGKNRLAQFKELLTRRGVATEFNSPTYSPIHAYAMAEIATWAGDDEVATLALQLEERTWVDLLGHFHVETLRHAGPYSRAYMSDSAGQWNANRFWLFTLFGDWLSAKELEPEFGYHTLNIGQRMSAAMKMIAEFHCPATLADTFFNKQYPYQFKATFECSPSTDHSASYMPGPDEDDPYEYPAVEGDIQTYMTADFALGTSTREFHNGEQTDAFHLLYRRTAQVRRPADIGTVFSRYVINGKEISSSLNIRNDEGRKLTLQHERVALVAYKPKLLGRQGIHSLALNLNLLMGDRFPEELYLGEREITEGSSEEPCSIYVRDGSLYMAFHPLQMTNHGRPCSVRVAKQHDFLVISLLNYEGEARDFARLELIATCNGFVAEVGSADTDGSFTDFRRRQSSRAVKDVLISSIHTRHRTSRTIRYARGGVQLELAYSPGSEGIRYQLINGCMPARPKLELTGVDGTVFSFN